MPKAEYAVFKALDPYFNIILQGLSGFVDAEHYFDAFADDALFESRYEFPGWPRMIHGRKNLMDALFGYGNSIVVHECGGLVVHASNDGRTFILEYEVHGKIVQTGASYDNRLISVITVENRKIVHWRDYMDSLAAFTALNGA